MRDSEQALGLVLEAVLRMGLCKVTQTPNRDFFVTQYHS